MKSAPQTIAALAMRAMSLGRAERKPLSTSQRRSETPIAALANCWWVSPNRRVSCGVMSSAAIATARAATGRMKRIIAAERAPRSVRRAPARSRLGQTLVKPGHDGDPLGLAHGRPGGDLFTRTAAADAQSRQRIKDADVDAGG